MYYLILSVSQYNIEAQRQGLVAIMYDAGSSKPDNSSVRRQVLQLRNSLPIKVASLHLCTDNRAVYSFLNLVLPMMNRRSLSRSRVHFGKPNLCS